MKESERLEQEAAQEDNDLVALGILTKALRSKRFEKFNERYLPRLIKMYDVELQMSGTRIRIKTDTKYGTIDFYPKANKVHFHIKNKWFKPGLWWIINHLFEEDEKEGK